MSFGIMRSINSLNPVNLLSEGFQEIEKENILDTLSNEKENSLRPTSQWDTLPPEITEHILQFLHSSEDLVQASRLNKMCHRLYPSAIDLSELFSGTVFLEKEWKNHFELEVKGPTLDKAFILRLLKSRCPFSKNGERIEETHTLLLLPEDLTIEKLVKLGKEKCPGGIAVWDRVLEEYKGLKIAKTHYVLIKNTAFREFNEEPIDQVIYGSGVEAYEASGVLSVLALNLVRYGVFNKKIDRNIPPVPMRCKEVCRLQSRDCHVAVAVKNNRPWIPDTTFATRNSWGIGVQRCLVEQS